MTELTIRQRRIFDFIRTEAQAGRPVPTLREIAHNFGFRSHRAAACHVNALIQKGFLQGEPRRARSLRVVSHSQRLRIVNIPLLGHIPAGFAQNREQEVIGCVSLDVESAGFTPSQNTFALQVKGDSMIARHIEPGDIIILERGPQPRDGQIVSALIDGEVTLKTFVQRKGKSYLKAENPKYPDMLPTHELTIQGVFRGLIRKATE